MNKICLELTMDQLVILDRALVELPYRVSAPLIAEINEQLKAQSENADAENANTGNGMGVLAG